MTIGRRKPPPPTGIRRNMEKEGDQNMRRAGVIIEDRLRRQGHAGYLGLPAPHSHTGAGEGGDLEVVESAELLSWVALLDER